MIPSLKLLHDALLGITREKTIAENAVKLAQSDISDSDENFHRRVGSLESQSAMIQGQIDKLVKTKANIDKEVDRMLDARTAGSGYIKSIRAKLKQYEIQEKTVQLAILQQELNNVQG
jgi:hypothetical protein